LLLRTKTKTKERTVETTTKKPQVRVSGYRFSPNEVPKEGSVTITGLDTSEVEKVQAAVKAGSQWMKVQDGRIDFHPAVKELPEPTEDSMLPFWRPLREGEGVVQEELLSSAEEITENHGSPAILIQHLCGYYYTPERYRVQAEQLESWGFECMRSRRGKEGGYWEIWYLPGLWSAKGSLKQAIGEERPSTKKAYERAIEHIRRRASFGTCDVAVQRLAMGVPD
jgi:hypothetical protein